MADLELSAFLLGKSEDERVDIAHRAGERLTLENLTDVERAAAEAIVRQLAQDAIDRVRQELSHVVKHAKHLSRDIAFKIAHDLDSIACPFLEVTEVFSDEDWKQLILTISREALIAVARRPSISEDLAAAIAEFADAVVAETLIDNNAAPMTPPVCLPLIERFGSSTWILDKLAARSDLAAELAVRLIDKVSSAALKKLSARYKLDDHIAPLVVDAEISTLLQLARETPESRYRAFTLRLHDAEKLTPHFLMRLLREGPLALFEEVISFKSGIRIEKVRSVVRREPITHFSGLLRNAKVPDTAMEQLSAALQEARRGLAAKN